MKKLVGFAAALALVSSAAVADHKAGHTANNPNAPGQDRVCLVTTDGGASGDVLATKWLPRKAAQAQSDENNIIGTSPLVQDQAGCENFDVVNN